jgi:NitT/TauT family transport system permease protein
VVAELVTASSGLDYLSLQAMCGFQVDVIFLAMAIQGLAGWPKKARRVGLD